MNMVQVHHDSWKKEKTTLEHPDYTISPGAQYATVPVPRKQLNRLQSHH